MDDYVNEFIIPRPKKEINFKNVGEAIALIDEHGDKSYDEIRRLLRNKRLDWTMEEVREYASKEKADLCGSLEEGLQNGDIFAGASIVVNCMHSPDGWSYCKELTTCDKEVPGTKMWLNAHQEQTKTKIAEMKEEDYFLICTKTLDGEIAKALLLRAGVDQERIIECEAKSWEAMDLPVKSELVDLRHEKKFVHGVGITGQAPERCDDIVSIKIGEKWTYNESTTASETIKKMFGTTPRVSEAIAVMYVIDPDKAIEKTQELDETDSDKFALYHGIAKRAAELEYIDPTLAKKKLEIEDRRALALFSEIKPIAISANRVTYTGKREFGYEKVETSEGEVMIPSYQISKDSSSAFVTSVTLVDAEYSIFPKYRNERETCSRKELTKILERDRNMDMENNRNHSEEQKSSISIKFK